MKLFSKKLAHTVCCGLLAISFFLRGAGAEATAGDKDVRTEAPVKLNPVKVTTDPFALWGISVAGSITPLNRLAGGPPKELYVGLVYAHSAADGAGVQSGDQITKINGTLLSEFPWRDLVKQMKYTEKGATISLTLYNWATNENRTVAFKLGSTGKWLQKGGPEEINCWGLLVVAEKPSEVHLNADPKHRRIKEWAQTPVMERKKVKGAPNPLVVAYDENGKMKTKLAPVYLLRRTVTIEWQGKPLTLIERENRTVEVIEADKVPKSDDVVGRLMHEGATLVLHADGSYELKDAPPKPETGNPKPETSPSSAIDQPAAAPTVVSPEEPGATNTKP